MHLILICLLHEEGKRAHLYPTNINVKVQQPTTIVASNNIYFDRQTFVQIVKVVATLINRTPYHLMREGLASIIMKSLIYNFQMLDKINNRDQLLRNEIFVAIGQALQKPELTLELKASFFASNAYSKSSEILLNTLFKVQNFISNEKIQILTTLGKNFPEVLT